MNNLILEQDLESLSSSFFSHHKIVNFLQKTESSNRKWCFLCGTLIRVVSLLRDMSLF